MLNNLPKITLTQSGARIQTLVPTTVQKQNPEKWWYLCKATQLASTGDKTRTGISWLPIQNSGMTTSDCEQIQKPFPVASWTERLAQRFGGEKPAQVSKSYTPLLLHLYPRDNNRTGCRVLVFWWPGSSLLLTSQQYQTKLTSAWQKR